MGVAGRCLDFGVPEQLTDHGQALTERQGAGGERMTQIMKPDIFEPGALSHAIPVTVEVRQAHPRFAARNDPGITGAARQARENFRCRW